MKALLPFMTLSIHLLLKITATGSFRLNWLQTYMFSSDRVVTHFGTLQMEDIQVMSFKNDAQFFTFSQTWSKGNQTDIFWNTFKVFLLKYSSSFRVHIDEINKQLGNKGPITIQCLIGCSSSIDNTTGFTFRVGREGEDLLYLNVTERVWVAGSSLYSQSVQKWMEKATATLNNIEIHVNTMCKSLSEVVSSAGKEAFTRKIQPQVYITRKSTKSGTEVICMVSGFYPKSINVSLWKENKIKNVTSTATLPNGDGTYQITVLANVNLTDPQSVYCQVEHSSLKEMLIVHLGSLSDRKSHTLIGLIVAITATFIFCVITVMCFVKFHKKLRQDGIKVASSAN